MRKITRSRTDDRQEPQNAGKPANSAIAVAIEHSPNGPDSLLKIIASGKGSVAEKILDIAFAEGVRVREDADLAEMLAAADIDTEIPVEAFIAVAEILSARIRCERHHNARGQLTMTKDEILEALKALRGVVEMGKDKLEEGQYIDMEMMQAKIDETCQEIAELEPEEAGEVREPLNDLLEDLQAYSAYIGEIADTGESNQTTRPTTNSRQTIPGPLRNSIELFLFEWT